MKDENRIIEILSELLIESQETRKEFKNVNSRLDKLTEGQEKLTEVQEKQSLAIGELRLSVMRLAEVIEQFANYDERIKKLERIVLKQAG